MRIFEDMYNCFRRRDFSGSIVVGDYVAQINASHWTRVRALYNEYDDERF